jgi:hypothetical protein
MDDAFGIGIRCFNGVRCEFMLDERWSITFDLSNNGVDGCSSAIDDKREV